VAATMFVPEQTVYLNNLRSVACSRRWENYTEVIRQFREPWRNRFTRCMNHILPVSRHLVYTPWCLIELQALRMYNRWAAK
jgi:hypothetical protein